MISVTRLNGQRFVVNAELIRTVESNPDTTIKLINGDAFIVRESMQEVVEAKPAANRQRAKAYSFSPFSPWLLN